MKYYETKIKKKAIISRIDKDEEVISSLEKIAKEEDIESAFFFAIGAVKNAIISYYDHQTKSYIDKEINEDVEVLSLNGNISYVYGEDKVIVHCHIVLSDRNFGLIGGHLKKAITSVTLETIIIPVEDRIERVKNEEFNLYIWKP